MNYILAICIVYLYAAIPFSLLVGKFVYNVDIRTIGSGNVGGTNLGRACGKRAFIYGFLLDASKGVVAVIVANLFAINPIFLMFFALIGHTLSIFIKFKGGKGVATAFGFVVAYTPIGALIAIIAFLICLKISKYVSLSSLCGIVAYLIFAITTKQNILFIFLVIAILIFISYLHRENLKKIKAGTENKITWM